MSGNIPLKDQKILCMKSGGRCAIPECRQELVIDKTSADKESIVGEMAHVKGEKPKAPRYDTNMTDGERNSYDNLILVCRIHHKMIDDQPNAFTVEKLHQIKKEHESWVQENLSKQMVNVTFAELEVITEYLNSNQPALSESYTVIPPKDKINKNNLSSFTEQQIMMGMLQVKQVAHYIDNNPDVEFGERLKQGFVIEYERLKNEENLSGNDLFENLVSFACQGHTSFKQMAAGLAVLVYLFEKCEVFEK
jgi:hypothetical protein